MNAGRRIPLWIIALLAAICLGVLAWTTFGFVVPFKHETGQVVLDLYFAGYDELTVGRMRRLLGQNEIANNLLRAMYVGPELIFPALFTALLLLVLMRLRPGGSYSARPLDPFLVKLVYAVPFIYGFADYGENISSLVAFGGGVRADQAAQLLPWLTRLKFASLAICLIVIARFAIIGAMHQDGGET
ncbi:hypothetical protein QO004_001413 [Rhizobium mesoamericanum]|uniref:hypothetical protein n=1 Tax=Rhizobium mesoamericanum TaxID=1079800 RepID=UPI00278774EB|nr:hypothetical protein [Rhizobium mesoamericanum]MDQ0559635.1 hypothetical protein [Rhizobium mesoamericanum]